MSTLAARAYWLVRGSAATGAPVLRRAGVLPFWLLLEFKNVCDATSFVTTTTQVAQTMFFYALENKDYAYIRAWAGEEQHERHNTCVGQGGV